MSVDPVKWIPASERCVTAASDTAAPGPATRLMTPGGIPAASKISMMTWAASRAVVAGFHTTVLPTIAGAAARLPPIDVKLNGLIASTKPSSGRWSMRFHIPAGGHRLHLLELLAEVHVPAPEVDQLAGGVDLGLMDALALSEDGGRVEAVAEGSAQEIGGAQEHRGPRLPGGGRPVVVRGQRRVDGGADVVGRSRSRTPPASGCAGGARSP